MTKPLKDWTLGEVQEECKRRGTPCASSGCPFYGKQGPAHRCKLRDLPPEAWNLTDTPTLTPDELAVLRLAKGLGAAEVIRGDMIAWASGDGLSPRQIPLWLLPSLSAGDTLDLTTMPLDPPQ